MRYPNLRYGKREELAYYAMGWPGPRLARFLRRDERTVRDWLSGRTRVPWWVPEILRLKQMEAELRHQQMGMGKLAPRLGVVSADVITLAPTSAVRADPVAQVARDDVQRDGGNGQLLHANLALTSSR